MDEYCSQCGHPKQSWRCDCPPQATGRVYSKRHGEKPVEMEPFARFGTDKDGNWFTTGV